MPTPEEIKAEMAGKFGSDKEKAAEAAKAEEAKKAAEAAGGEKKEEPKKEEKKVEFDPDDILGEGEEKKEEALPTYEEVAKDELKRRHAFEHQRKMIDDLRKEVDTLKNKPADESERVKELQAKLAKMDALEDPDFQKEYIEPMNRSWGDIEVTLKQLQVADDNIKKLKSANINQRLALMPVVFKGKESAIAYLSPMFADYDKHRLTATEAWKKADETVKTARANRSKARESEVGGVAESVVQEMAKTHKALARDAGQTAKNARIDKVVSEAKGLAAKLGGDPKVAFETAMMAVLGKHYARSYADVTSKLSDAEKSRIAALRGRASLGGNGGSRSGGEGERIDFSKVKSSEHGKAMFESMQKKLGHG